MAQRNEDFTHQGAGPSSLCCLWRIQRGGRGKVEQMQCQGHEKGENVGKE